MGVNADTRAAVQYGINRDALRAGAEFVNPVPVTAAFCCREAQRRSNVYRSRESAVCA